MKARPVLRTLAACWVCSACVEEVKPARPIAPAVPAPPQPAMMPGDPLPEPPSAASLPSSEPAVPVVNKSCGLTEWVFALGKKQRVIVIEREQGRVIKVGTQDAPKGEVYTYSDDGSLQSVSMGKNSIRYRYDDGGVLVKLVGKGAFMTRALERDEQGRVIKQTTLLGKKPYSAFTYVYGDGSCPEGAEVQNKKGKVTEELAFGYDDKHNPFVGLTGSANPGEMMFGYPVGQCQHNLVQVTRTYKLKPKKKAKQVGDQDVRSVTMTYNDDGYPVTIIRGNGASEPHEQLSYSCE